MQILLRDTERNLNEWETFLVLIQEILISKEDNPPHVYLATPM
jgi:hypothetical protein